MNKVVWIGLAKVSAKKGSDTLGQYHDAYVNILALSRDIEEFYSNVSVALESLHLELVQVEEVEKFSDRIKRFEVDDHILRLADELCEDSKVRFGNFHVYEQENEREDD